MQEETQQQAHGAKRAMPDDVECAIGAGYDSPDGVECSGDCAIGAGYD